MERLSYSHSTLLGWLVWGSLFILLLGAGCNFPALSPSSGRDTDLSGAFPSGTATAEVQNALAQATEQPATPTLTPSGTSTSTSSPSPEPLTVTPTATPGPVVIGYSVNGLPLEVWRFGTGLHQRMIVAGIHGGYEWNTIALADELIAQLLLYPELVPPDKTLFILRNLNPDGEKRDHGPDGRANANGVDLNRNFPTGWMISYPRSGCWQLRPISPGLEPASEPETQAFIYFFQSHAIEALISYHSAGLGIFPGGKPTDLVSASLAERLSAVSGYPYPPVETGCVYTGMLANWTSAQGAASVDIELSNHWDSELQTNLKVISAFLEWEP